MTSLYKNPARATRPASCTRRAEQPEIDILGTTFRIIGRQAISSWMPLEYGSDGSLDIHIQKDPPGKERQSNWLPAPEGDFNLTLRMYWPKDEQPSILEAAGPRLL